MKGSIIVKNLSKDFKLPHEKSSTLKGTALNLIRLRRNRIVETQRILDNISLSIKPGEFFGVLGRNGSGKSTLLKILAGIYQPTSGEAKIEGKLVPFIELGVGFNGELSGRDNVYLNGSLLGFSKSEMDGMYSDIVEFAELENFMDQKLKNYSSGMQVRLAFSIAVRAEADILLIDEVLAVGDAAFQRKCFEYFKKLKKNKKTVVFVTHDMAAVREYCDRAILIEKNQICYEGNADDVASEYNRLFTASEELSEKPKHKDDKRSGSKEIVFTKLSVPKRITKQDKELLVNVQARVNANVESPNFGFSIHDASGVILCGTNSQILDQQFGRVEKGQKIRLEWGVPNIFNDGLHYVNVAIVGRNETEQYDWWDEAAAFRSYREDKSPYLTNPAVSLKVDLR